MKMELFRIDYLYEKELIVRMYGRDDQGAKWVVGVTGTEPWFCVNEDPSITLKNDFRVARIEKWGTNLQGQQLWKIVAKAPFYVGETGSRSLAVQFPFHYEADIPYNRRIMIDMGIRTGVQIPDVQLQTKRDVGGRRIPVVDKRHVEPVDVVVPPRLGIIDIENDDSKGFMASERPYGEVVCVSVYDSYDDAYQSFILGGVDQQKVVAKFTELGLTKRVKVKMCSTEADLFRLLKEFMDQRDYDIITGWNVDYDIGYLQERAKLQGYVCPEMRFCIDFDMQEGYTHLHLTKSYQTLQESAHEVLDYGKLPRHAIHILFKDDKPLLLAYNLWDVELVRRIDEKLGVLTFLLGIKRQVGLPFEATFHNSLIVDTLILRHLKGTGIALPSLKFLKQRVEHIKGGHVESPHTGIVENVAVADFTATYPSIISSFNISPETRVPKDSNIAHINALYWGYRTDIEGIMPQLLRTLMDKRKVLQKKRDEYLPKDPEYEALHKQQEVTKYTMNSFFGVLSSEVYRLADRDMADDITGLGRKLLLFVKDALEAVGYKVLYGDTDSLMFQLPDPMKMTEAVPIIREAFDRFSKEFGITKSFFDVKVETVFEKWFQAGTKKRYTGWIKFMLKGGQLVDATGWPDEKRLKIVGYEARRFDASELTKMSQKVGFPMMFRQGPDQLAKYLRSLVKALEAGEWNESILIPATFNRRPEDYETIGASIRGAMYGNDHLNQGIQVGNDFKWCYVKSVTGKPPTDVVGIAWENKLPPEVIIDTDEMVRRCLKDPWEPILEGLGLTWDEVVTGLRQVALF